MILPILSSALLLTGTLTLATPTPSKAPAGVSISLNKGPAAVHLHDDAVVDLEWLKRTKARTQRKYSGLNTKEVKRASAGEALTPSSDESLWYGPITIGGKPFSVDFDTGSSDLWVPASSCTTGGCVGHKKYSLTSTGTAQSGNFMISYGDGSSTSGPIYKDTVTVAGLTATTQSFSAVTEMADSFASSSFPADGILGMAFPTLSSLKANPFFQTLIAQGKVSSPVFSFYLASTGAELYLGGTDAAKFSGAITYTPVTQAAYWTVALGGVKAGTTPIGVKSTSAIIDTGTTLVYSPLSDAAAIYAGIPGSKTMNSLVGSGYDGYYAFPCASNPTVSLTFGGKDFKIPTSALSLGQVSSGSKYCVGSIVGSDQFPSSFLVGDAFLSNVYSVYDVGNKRVGFANLK